MVLPVLLIWSRVSWRSGVLVDLVKLNLGVMVSFVAYFRILTNIFFKTVHVVAVISPCSTYHKFHYMSCPSLILTLTWTLDLTLTKAITQCKLLTAVPTAVRCGSCWPTNTSTIFDKNVQNGLSLIVLFVINITSWYCNHYWLIIAYLLSICWPSFVDI